MLRRIIKRIINFVAPEPLTNKEINTISKIFNSEEEEGTCPVCGKLFSQCEYFKRLETKGDED